MPSKQLMVYLDEIAAVAVQLEVMQMDDVGGDGVQEVSVMTHDHQGLLPPRQVLLEPQHCP